MSASASTSVGAGVEATATALRFEYDVLVLDAGSRQSLAAVRSLGRAGLRVATAECFVECDPDLPVHAFRSRYNRHSEVLPSYATDPVGFADAVVDFVVRHPTRVVLPAGDGTIAAVRARRTELEQLGCRLALPPELALDVANDKGRTLAAAQALGIDQPPTLRIDSADELAGVVEQLGFPLVLKPAVSWADHATVRLQPVEVVDAAEAAWVTETFLDAGAEVLAQEWLSGAREGVTLMVADGEVRALFAHLEHRTSPALGGASVLRESIPVPADIERSTRRLVEALGLDGLCEVEFRRDRTGRPMLMEINARMAGTVEIAQACGVDFPLMVWRWATGEAVEPVTGYRTGVRMRWLRGDMRWLRDNFRRVGRPDSYSRARSLWMFVSEFVRTRHYDCADAGDLRPVLAEAVTTVAAVGAGPRRSSASTPPRLFNPRRQHHNQPSPAPRATSSRKRAPHAY